MQNGANCFFHVHGLIKDNAGQHLLRDVVEMLDELPNAIHNGDGVGIAALLHDRNVHRFLAVNTHNVGLDSMCIFSLTHIIHRHPGMSSDLERNLS